MLQGFGRGDLATTPYGAGGEFSIVFVITAVVWGYVFAFLGAKGIDYVARVATFLPLLIIAMLVIGAIIAARSLSSYDRADSSKAAFVAANVLDAAEKAADEAAQKAGKTAKMGISLLMKAGAIVVNQTPIIRGINDIVIACYDSIVWICSDCMD